MPVKRRVDNHIPPTFEVVQAGWRDLGDLRQLEQVCFEKDAWPLIDLIAVLTFPGVIRYKAVVDGVMAGFVSGSVKDRVGWVTTIGVHLGYRRMGIGAALLKICEDALNLPLIRLTVRRSNYAAIEMYRQAGYHQAEVWDGYYEGEEDGLVLEKRC